MVRFTKGQSAIEYLMTYGWMLLVIAIVGGLLFALFQDQELQDSSYEGFGDDIEITDVAYGNSTVSIGLRNLEAETIENVEVSLNHTDHPERTGNVSSIEAAGESVVEISGFTNSSSTISYDAVITYEMGETSPSTEGTINVAAEPQ
jgi:hypothetical protein